MRVKITHPVWLPGAPVNVLWAGVEYELPDDVAEAIIEQEMGYEIEQAEEKPPKRGKK